VVEQFSKLGEHGAIWLAIGLAGAATREPRMPVRGCSSMSRSPASFRRASSASMSGVW
jgi:hypothetical protein